MALLSTLSACDIVHAAPWREASAAGASDLVARRERAALVPEIVLRFTYANVAGVAQLGAIDTPTDAWNWPVALGATIELRALWTFDRGAHRVAPPTHHEDPLP